MLGRHRQAPVRGSQPCPSAPPTSHRQPATGESQVSAAHPQPALALFPHRARAPGARSTICREQRGHKAHSHDPRGPPGAPDSDETLGPTSDVCQGHGRERAAPVPSTGLARLSEAARRVPARQPGPPRGTQSLTAAAKVVSSVQPEEAVPARCAGLATHVRLAGALAVALWPGEKVRPSREGRDAPAPQPPGTSAPRLTGRHSATPPSVPRGSQLQPRGEAERAWTLRG